MKLTRFLLVLAFGLSSGLMNSANAALIGACTFPAGCGPDFNIVGLTVDYGYNAGLGKGTLTVNGTAGNASFLPDQLSPWPDASDMILAIDPDISIPVSSATTSGNDNFSMTMSVDGSGNLLGGGMTMNGKVAQFFSPLNNTNPAFQAFGLYTATSANGVVLDGALISGSSMTAMGFDGTTIDFRATLDASSLLSLAYGSTAEGILSLSGISSSTGLVKWDEDWTVSSATLDVAVPVPAAFWLFLSGMIALFSTSKSRK